jgi:hypothetical protein
MNPDLRALVTLLAELAVDDYLREQEPGKKVPSDEKEKRQAPQPKAREVDFTN